MAVVLGDTACRKKGSAPSGDGRGERPWAEEELGSSGKTPDSCSRHTDPVTILAHGLERRLQDRVGSMGLTEYRASCRDSMWWHSQKREPVLRGLRTAGREDWAPRAHTAPALPAPGVLSWVWGFMGTFTCWQVFRLRREGGVGGERKYLASTDPARPVRQLPRWLGWTYVRPCGGCRLSAGL